MREYLDSNIFIYALLSKDNRGFSCQKIISDVINNKNSALTSFLTWDEIVYIIKKHRGTKIAIIEGRKILQMPNLSFIKVDEQIISNAQKLIEIYNLNPRDAIHIASAIISNCDGIVSDDSDFDNIKEIKRIKV